MKTCCFDKSSYSATSAVIATLLATLAISRPGMAELVSVDFENSNAQSVTYSGVEPLAASFYGAFGGANVWNSALLGHLSPQTNPSFPALKYSTGLTSPMGISFTGAVDSYASQDNSAPNVLFKEFIYLNSGTLDWQLTGVPTDNITAMYFYNFGDGSQSYREFDMKIDRDGDGTLETTATVDDVNGVGVFAIQPDPNGIIRGQMVVTNGQASWSGFQISVPEPASLGAIGIAAMVMLRRRKA
ncbi:MAG: PEP-CTERM sorting domain-containing protein [Burkholderiales bacterium]|nr:PEP-CTERM sorting domain-containing protein [Phycisphaerae bacterium]